MFIAIEGLDGVGKTTIAKQLAHSIGATYLSTPSSLDTNIRANLESFYASSISARQLFYASTVVLVSDEIRHLTSQGKDVVVDRYWLSTQVYHDWKNEGEHYELTEVLSGLVKPDMTLYLDLPIGLRRQRILKRESNTIEDHLSLKQEVNDKLVELYDKHYRSSFLSNYVTIDASLSSIEVINLIRRELQI